MSQTLEHAIGDDAMESHELGHAVVSRLQKVLKGSTVEFAFPGIVTVQLKSGAVARCGGPGIGWMVDVMQRPGAETDTVGVDVAFGETSPVVIADAIAKALRRR